MIRLLNAMAFDYAVLGNHEFDFGDEVLAERMAQSRFTWLSSNVLGADGKPFGGAAAVAVHAFSGLQGRLLRPFDAGHRAPLQRRSRGHLHRHLEAAQDAIAVLRAEGADLIVALTHLSLAEDQALIRALPEIDLVLGGHEHIPITFEEGGALLLKAGTDAEYLVAADLVIDITGEGDERKVAWRAEWRYLATAGIAGDPEIAALVAKEEAALSGELDQRLAITTTELDSRRATVRGRESTMGDVIADAMRAAVTADVAITNGGGIRGDRLYEAGTWITRRDVLSELPFGNVTVKLEVGGAALLQVLEHGLGKVEDRAGRFPQVSGLSVTFDRNKPEGSRVLAVSIAGQPPRARAALQPGHQRLYGRRRRWLCHAGRPDAHHR